MTDDEKMLLVAKACGWTLEPRRAALAGRNCCWCVDLMDYFEPLLNSDITLEIVTKLDLIMHPDKIHKVARCWQYIGNVAISIPANGDMPAALCRAVFEVAATIGATLGARSG